MEAEARTAVRTLPNQHRAAPVVSVCHRCPWLKCCVDRRNDRQFCPLDSVAPLPNAVQLAIADFLYSAGRAAAASA